MSILFCPNEEKVAELLSKNIWPWSADPVLAAHVAECSRCSEVVFTAQILKQDRAATMLTAHTDSPYHLWWRAQLRRRNSTVEQVTRPLAWAEKLALFCMLCVAGGLVYWQWRQVSRWVGWLGGNFENKAFWSALSFHSAVQSSLMGYLILAGIAAVACIWVLTLLMSGAKE
jgi:hypothetical protein